MDHILHVLVDHAWSIDMSIWHWYHRLIYNTAIHIASMVMKHTVTELEPKSGLEPKLNPLLEWMPESAWFQLASMWCNFEYLVIAAEFNLPDAD